MLAILAGDRRRVVEVGTAIGYSTLWMALALPRRHDRDDRPRPCAPTARGSSGAAPACRMSGSPWSTRRRSTRSRASTPELAGPFDLVFIDALKDEYPTTSARSGRGSPRARWSSRTTSCGAAGRPARGQRVTTTAPTRSASSAARCRPTRNTRRRSCPSAMASSSRRSAADGGDPLVLRRGDPVHVRLFAMQRELAGTRGAGPVPAGRARRSRTPGPRSSARIRPSRPAGPRVRFARNGAYAPPETTLADGDEVAMIPPVSGGSDDRAVRILEIRRTDRSGRRSWPSWARLATPEDGAVVGSWA